MDESIELTLHDMRALQEAYRDTHRVWATYNRLIEKCGVVPPLDRLREDAARHIDTLEALLARHGIHLSDAGSGELVPHFSTIPQAVAAAMTAAARGNMRDRPPQAVPAAPETVLKVSPIATRHTVVSREQR
jgi:hypothetical protein